MTFFSPDKKPSLIQLLILTLSVVIGILYFGLRPKGDIQGNKTTWLNPPPGLAFDRYAMAYTEKFSSNELFSEKGGALTIELAIEPEFGNESGFMHLLVIHDGDDERQLVIGQWRTSLVIMNGNDYSNKRRTPKIYAKLGEPGTPKFLTIVSDGSGTQFYINSTLNRKSSRLKLRYPDHRDQVRMVVANSLSGKNPWAGKIFGVSLYDYALDAEAIRHHFNQWRSQKNFYAFRNDSPSVLYAFNEGQGRTVHSRDGLGPNLNVPLQMKVLQKNVLAWPSLPDLFKRGMVIDLLTNLLGFFPLGFILFATIERIKIPEGRGNFLLAVLLSSILSLSIEISQIWLPFRDSSSLDLLLNITGSTLGAVSYKAVCRF